MRAWLVAGMCALAGCGDDVAGGSSFRVAGVTPAHGAAGVDIATQVVIELSEPVDPDTVDPASVALDGITAALAVDGAVITLTPGAPLAHQSEVRLEISTALTSAAGEPLAAPYASTFTTRARRWSEPQALGPGSDQTGSSEFRPLVAGAPGGDAVAVWEDDADGGFRLYAAIYRAEVAGWSEAEELASSAEYSLAPQLARDAEGRFLLVWRSASRIEQAWYHPDNATWYHAAPIHIGETVVTPPVLALSRSGEGALVWSESSGRMIALLDGDAWGEPAALGAGTAEQAALAVEDGGAVTAVWRRPAALAAQRIVDGVAGGLEPIWQDADDAIADRPRVAALPGGGVVAAWGVVRAGGAEVHARRFDGAWGEDAVIGEATTAAETRPELAATADGDLLVVWDDWNGGLFARWWRADEADWAPVATLEPTDGAHAPEHAVAVGPDGAAVTAYAAVRAATYRPDRDQWLTGEVAASAVTGPIAVTFAGGDPLAVWEQYRYDEGLGAPVQEGMRASFFR